MHPFLDVEMSTQERDSSKGLLADWVPGNRWTPEEWNDH